MTPKNKEKYDDVYGWHLQSKKDGKIDGSYGRTVYTWKYAEMCGNLLQTIRSCDTYGWFLEIRRWWWQLWIEHRT